MRGEYIWISKKKRGGKKTERTFVWNFPRIWRSNIDFLRYPASFVSLRPSRLKLLCPVSRSNFHAPLRLVKPWNKLLKTRRSGVIIPSVVFQVSLVFVLLPITAELSKMNPALFHPRSASTDVQHRVEIHVLQTSLLISTKIPSSYADELYSNSDNVTCLFRQHPFQILFVEETSGEHLKEEFLALSFYYSSMNLNSTCTVVAWRRKSSSTLYPTGCGLSSKRKVFRKPIPLCRRRRRKNRRIPFESSDWIFVDRVKRTSTILNSPHV